MDINLTTTMTQALQITSVGTGDELPIVSEFIYDPADPYAITLLLRGTDGDVTWSFARDLLAEGCFEPSGDGDVHVWPCLGTEGEAVVIIELNNDEESSLLQFPSREVHRFLQNSFAAVPTGQERRHLDVDAWLRHIFV